MPGKQPRVLYRCSFCGKAQDAVRRLIAGPGGVYICNECIDQCREMTSDEQQAMSAQASDVQSSKTISSREDGTTERLLEALVHELAEARATIERLAGENGALRERLAQLQQ
jgi:hypothetical protein